MKEAVDLFHTRFGVSFKLLMCNLPVFSFPDKYFTYTEVKLLENYLTFALIKCHKNNNLACRPRLTSLYMQIKFLPALSREFRPYKPDPAPLHFICKAWDVQPNEVIMIGDSLKDDVSWLALCCKFFLGNIIWFCMLSPALLLLLLASYTVVFFIFF